MALDDREQRILEEIERQFYAEDPKLAETVRTTTLAKVSRRQLKWAILVLVAGVAMMLGSFTVSTYAALAGFVVMVVGLAWIIAIVQRRSGAGIGKSGALLARLRRRGGDG